LTPQYEEHWWESTEGEWFWRASDGNWYPASSHPTGVPEAALATSRSSRITSNAGIAGVEAQAKAGAVRGTGTGVEAGAGAVRGTGVEAQAGAGAVRGTGVEAQAGTGVEAQAGAVRGTGTGVEAQAKAGADAVPGQTVGTTANAPKTEDSTHTDLIKPLNPWEAARQVQPLSLAIPDPVILAGDEPKVGITHEAEREAWSRTEGIATLNKFAVWAGVVVVALAVSVPATMAMATRKAAPFLTPGQTLAQKLENTHYRTPHLASWAKRAAPSLGAIYDDHQVLQNAAIEVAYTQGQKGQPSLFAGCLQIYADVRKLTRSR